MEDVEIIERLKKLEQKIDATYQSTEKTRKYFLILMVASVVAFIVPLIGLLIEIPTFISTYQSISNIQ